MLATRIVHRNMNPSEALDGFIQEQVQALARIEPRLQSCEVILKAVHGRLQKGRSFLVRIDLGLPGRHIAAGAGPDRAHGHMDVYAAVAQSFDRARRQTGEARAWMRKGRRKLAAD